MKFLSKNNGVITILLIMLLLVSSFFIIQLEMRAASLQSRLDEHHKQLQNNSDVLEGLVFFDRGTSKANIQLTEDIAFLSSELASIKLKNNKVEIETPGDIQIGNGKDIRFGYSKKLDVFYMINKGTKLNFGKLINDDGTLDYGAIIKNKSGDQFVFSDDGAGFWVNSDDGLYSLKLTSKKKFVELKKGNSKIRFEGDDISIEAEGNINITSKNGKVNINGKR